MRTTQLDLTRARAKVRWFARYAKLLVVLLVVFWGFGKLCCNGDGKWSEQSICWTKSSEGPIARTPGK